MKFHTALNNILDEHGLEPVSQIVANEFKRIEEIRRVSRLLAKASLNRESFFSTLPPELLGVIAIKMGSTENDVEDHADIELAANSNAKPS